MNNRKLYFDCITYMLWLVVIETVLSTVMASVFGLRGRHLFLNSFLPIVAWQVFWSGIRVLFFYPIWVPFTFWFVCKTGEFKFGVLYNFLSYLLLTLLYLLILPDSWGWLGWRFNGVSGTFYYTAVATLLSPVILPYSRYQGWK
ncbi:hypothetical protein CLV59_109229 [Chitinophaga dinghuensis]|uniref:Uncharacterized protein n=1 Tax=Chitinophaga dinghuensis TaxID=1539050 RepID=A0A327VP56_9BACT|nr:hypothetical protein [Chitinophaga dinghuensis]RAJ75615.1 hypothetical protein CLV59_109229 [Chitinophaga dinghuensis]